MWEQSTLRLAPRLSAHRRKDRHHNFLPLSIELARFQLEVAYGFFTDNSLRAALTN